MCVELLGREGMNSLAHPQVFELCAWEGQVGKAVDVNIAAIFLAVCAHQKQYETIIYLDSNALETS